MIATRRITSKKLVSCYVCSNNFEVSTQAHGSILNGTRIHICGGCNRVKKTCKNCGSVFETTYIKSLTTVFCSRRCSSSYTCKIRNADPDFQKQSLKTRREKGVGVFDINHQKRANKLSHTKEANDKRKENMKKNKSGVYNPKYKNIWIKNLGNHFNNYFEDGNKCDIHIDETLTYRGTCWSCYKIGFGTSSISGDVISEKYKNSFYQKTYRLHTGNRTGQNAMERELVEKGIGWFVYIKFCIGEDGIKPLVVGKTGSLLVNSSGTDINFSINKETPARVFLKEESKEWYEDEVLVIPVETEKEAYDLETEIFENFDLFMS